MKEYNFKKLRKRCEEWFNPSSEAWMWEEPRKEILEYINVSQNPTAALVSLRQLAAWFARKACVAIAKGDSTGWKEMALYLHVAMGCLRLEVMAARSGANRVRYRADSTLNPFHLLSVALALRNWSDATWLGDEIMAARSTQMFGENWGSRRSEPFRSYVGELYAKLVGQTLPDEFGPYRQIFDAWESPPELSRAIKAACDYHVKQIEPEDRD